MRYWQDLQTGESFHTHAVTVSKSDILGFAAEFDPQPYHLNQKAGDESIFGGLCASGWQLAALMMRLLSDEFKARDIALMGQRGVPSMRWKIPVYAEDSLHAGIRITHCQRESGRSGLGLVCCDITVSNQHENTVIELKSELFVLLGQAHD